MTDDVDRQALLGLAEWVRRSCAERRLTQRELARRSGLRRELVGRVFRGQANPSFTVLTRLVHGMGASLRDLGEAVDARRERLP